MDAKYLADQVAEAYAGEYADSRETLDVLDRKAFAVAAGSGAFVAALLAMARLDFGELSAVCIFASSLMIAFALLCSFCATWVAYLPTRPSGNFVSTLANDLADAAIDVSEPELRLQNQLSHTWIEAIKDTKEAADRKAWWIKGAQLFLLVATLLTTVAIGFELLAKGKARGETEETAMSEVGLR